MQRCKACGGTGAQLQSKPHGVQECRDGRLIEAVIVQGDVGLMQMINSGLSDKTGSDGRVIALGKAVGQNPISRRRLKARLAVRHSSTL